MAALSLDRLPANELVMTQELIANMLGVRREEVPRLRKPAKAGLIQYSRGHITVLTGARGGLRLGARAPPRRPTHRAPAPNCVPLVPPFSLSSPPLLVERLGRLFLLVFLSILALAHMSPL